MSTDTVCLFEQPSDSGIGSIRYFGELARIYRAMRVGNQGQAMERKVGNKRQTLASSVSIVWQMQVRPSASRWEHARS